VFYGTDYDNRKDGGIKFLRNYGIYLITWRYIQEDINLIYSLEVIIFHDGDSHIIIKIESVHFFKTLVNVF
jgi:hypothetical protein